MRYLFGFLCVCALAALPLVGCSETTGPGGSGGNGGSAGAGGGGDGGTGGDGGVGGDDDPIADLVDKIRTEVDPAFVYSYEQTKFVPPTGKTLLIVGQTVEDINDYTANFPNEPTPGGWAAGWGIPNTDGLAYHQELVDRFPNTVLQSGLWMVGMWGVAKDTADGVYDDVIREFSTWAKTTNCPIYLRIGYEFDGWHNELEPSEYVTAYRRFVDITREEDVNNVAFVWHSYAAPPYKGYPLASWYPGDDYVDWVAVSLFGHLYGPDPGPDANAVFDFAKTHRKPMMVAESSPFLGIFEGDLDSWDTWFVNYFSLAYERNIKAISFINADFNQYPFLVELGWQDARLQNNKTVAKAWFMETAKNRYLKQSPQLFEQLGFSP